MTQGDIVVVGAGIIGLDVALCLAERGLGSSVLVVAEYLTGDTSTTYTSPWAGANFSAISGSDPNALRWDRLGYARLMKLAEDFGSACFIEKTSSSEYWDEKPPADKIESMAEYLRDTKFRILGEDERPEGTESGVSFTTVTINAPMHLQWLSRRLQKVYGVRFLRRKVESLLDTFAYSSSGLVFNCVGNAARDLDGVQDPDCYPTRGQVLLTKAPQVKVNVMRHGRDYETYIIPRPSSNGKVILGGFMQKNVCIDATFGHETESIWVRASRLLLTLKSEHTEVLAAFAGHRPSRHGGARVEKQAVDLEDQKRKGIVVHNYGAGGTGHQAGLGMAQDAVGLIEEELNSVSQRHNRAHL